MTETHGVETLKHRYVTYIRATPEALWRAITDGAFTQRYFHGTQVVSSLEPGAPFLYKFPDGSVCVSGEVVESDPPRRLVHTWQFQNPERELDPPSRVTWEIERDGPLCKLTLIHDGFPRSTATYGMVRDGWPLVLSGLKTLLETGQAMAEPEPETVESCC